MKISRSTPIPPDHLGGGSRSNLPLACKRLLAYTEGVIGVFLWGYASRERKSRGHGGVFACAPSRACEAPGGHRVIWTFCSRLVIGVGDGCVHRHQEGAHTYLFEHQLLWTKDPTQERTDSSIGSPRFRAGCRAQVRGSVPLSSRLRIRRFWNSQCLADV